MDPEVSSSRAGRPASYASSSRTVRPMSRSLMTPTTFMSHNDVMIDTTHSQQPISQRRSHHHHHGHSRSTSHLQPPIPPTHSSSLSTRAHPSLPSLVVPSVQVIQPTPTKIKTYRRKSFGQASVSSNEIATHDSPSRRSTLDVRVDVDPDSVLLPRRAPVRTRPLMEDEDDDDSELKRKREAEEEKRARVREKGRERQRRKRERDKKAKDEAKASGNSPLPTTALTTATHLPIPARNPSIAKLLPSTVSPHSQTYPVSASVPSSTSSNYSPLPGASGYIGLSPNTSFTGASASGQSSPNALFSPARTSTPSMSYSEGTSMWSGENSSSGSVLDFSSRPRMTGRGRPRASSGANKFKLASIPANHALTLRDPVKDPTPGPSPSKRRKSEPESEEFRSHKHNEVGLGVTIGDNTWDTETTGDRPRPRRTTSDSASIPQQRAVSRSPTPPPVPSVPAEYRKPSTSATSEAGAFFATTLILGYQKSSMSKVLEASLGVGRLELEEMKMDLAGVYDRWNVESGLRNVSLSGIVESAAESAADKDVGTVSETSIMSASTAATSAPTSPTHSAPDHAQTSFFTPARNRSNRTNPSSHPQTLPILAPPQLLYPNQIGYSHDSPLAAQAHHLHFRTQSLSSHSMKARGLVINPSATVPLQQPTRWPDTPPRSDRQQGSEANAVSPGNTSLQTPSTGHGSFPSAESLGITLPMGLPGMSGQLRSATDPTHPRMYTTQHDLSGDMDVDMGTGDGGGYAKIPSTLESPLAMSTDLSSRGHPPLPPPPSTEPRQPRSHVQTHSYRTGHSHAVSHDYHNYGTPSYYFPQNGKAYHTSGPMGHQQTFSTPNSTRAQATHYTPPTAFGDQRNASVIYSSPMYYDATGYPQLGNSGGREDVMREGEGMGDLSAMMGTFGYDQMTFEATNQPPA